MTPSRPEAPDELDALPTQENLENFSLHDYFSMGWDTIEAKTQVFAPFIAKARSDGFIMREVCGAASHRVPVRDASTGEVKEVLMFGSNNYLGLANEPFVVERMVEALRTYGAGCAGPPLLNGTTSLHKQLEQRLAEFKHCEAVLLYPSGFSANLGWVSGLLSSKDVLIYDAQSHASLFDAMKLGKVESFYFHHNNVEHLRQRLMQARWKHAYTNVVVCVEGVYSMDGDVAPLREIRQLCTKYSALLALDDAHGAGVLGANGRGTPEHFGLEGEVDVVMGTFSKAFAVTGGFVGGSAKLVEYLRAFSRPHMFSATLPPVTVAVLAGLDFLRDHPERVRALHDNVAYMVKGLKQVGFEVEVQTAIIPLFVPAPVDLHKVVQRLFEEGVFVNGVEFPAVPRDRQRLRISLMATFSRADLDFAIDKLAKVGRELGFLKSEP